MRRQRTTYPQAHGIQPMLVECWASIVDAGPTFNQHWLIFRVCWDACRPHQGASLCLWSQCQGQSTRKVIEPAYPAVSRELLISSLLCNYIRVNYSYYYSIHCVKIIRYYIVRFRRYIIVRFTLNSSTRNFADSSVNLNQFSWNYTQTIFNSRRDYPENVQGSRVALFGNNNWFKIDWEIDENHLPRLMWIRLYNCSISLVNIKNHTIMY